MSEKPNEKNPEPTNEPAPLTDAQVTAMFAAMIAPLRDTAPANQSTGFGAKYLAARKELEGLRAEVADLTADRDQLRQALEDLDEQVDQLTRMLNDKRPTRARRIRKADQ